MGSSIRRVVSGALGEIGGTRATDDASLTSPSCFNPLKTKRPIIQLDLTMISKESPFQTRQDGFDPKAHPEDEELMESVRVNGVLEPIMVLAVPSHGQPRLYQTVFGHRRVAAARLAGFDEITAIVVQKEDEARFLTIAENMGSRRLTPYEKALALVKLQEIYPELSIRELGRESGIPFQSISTLIRAYQESPPILRGMFAEGLAPGAVLQLKPLFEATPEDERQQLAKALRGLTRRQARGIRILVDRGETPHDAIQAVLVSEANQRLSPIRPSVSAPNEAKNEPIEVPRKPPTPLPSMGDRKSIDEIAEYTGASKAKVRRLIERAGAAQESKEVLVLACAYTANRGEEEIAIQRAKLVYEDYDLYKLLRRFLNLKKSLKRQVPDLQDQEKLEFTNRIVLGK